MTTINLYQSQEEKKGISSRAANGGFLFSLSMLIVTLLALGGLKIAASVITKNSSALAETIKIESEGLTGFGDLEQIVDLQSRLEQIKNNLNIKNGKVSLVQMTDVLDHLGAELSSNVTVSEYILKDGKITVTIDTNNFNDAARQIQNFKKSTYFTNVELKRISRGKLAINTEIEMSIK